MTEVKVEGDNLPASKDNTLENKLTSISEKPNDDKLLNYNEDSSNTDKPIESTIMSDSDCAKNELNTSNSSTNNPYAYLHRKDFTSEKFKIEIRGLPKYYGINEFRRLLYNKLKLNPSKFKVPRTNCPWAYVCFRNEEDRQAGIQVITGHKWKGNVLNARTAKPMPDPLVKRRMEDNLSMSSHKKLKLDNETTENKLRNSTIPFWNTPYEVQLKNKQEEMKMILVRYSEELKMTNPALKQWIAEKKLRYNGLPCEFWDIRYSNSVVGYRNKCEFSIGRHEETKLPTIGFRVGTYAKGSVGVAPIDCLEHIPDRMKKAVKLFEEYVRASSFEVYDPEIQIGYFKQLTVRYSAISDQLMLVINVYSQQMSDEETSSLKEDIRKFFAEGKGKEANVTSLYYHSLVKSIPNEPPSKAEHLLGDKYIYDTIMGLKFRISPEAFFQINTSAAEILYNSAIELADPSPDSTVLDICCGTGTIGLCFAAKCKQVLGVEINDQAVIDAKQNAIDNNIKNCEFFAGKAEEILSSVMSRATSNDIIAILDPPRAGLHNRGIEMLRKANKVNKLIYISCRADSAFKNFIHLARPESKTVHGAPFVPVRAVAVDMFPHTKHCELIMYFERWKESNPGSAESSSSSAEASSS